MRFLYWISCENVSLDNKGMKDINLPYCKRWQHSPSVDHPPPTVWHTDTRYISCTSSWGSLLYNDHTIKWWLDFWRRKCKIYFEGSSIVYVCQSPEELPMECFPGRGYIRSQPESYICLSTLLIDKLFVTKSILLINLNRTFLLFAPAFQIRFLFILQ